MSERPFIRHGAGISAGLGIIYKLKDKMQFTCQVKTEFTFTNVENIDETTFTYVPGVNNTTGFKYKGHLYNNYAKYMDDPNKNWNRAGTHPFNLGLTFGIRYYLFDFNN